MSRPRLPDAERSVPFMISIPPRVKALLEAHVAKENVAGRKATLSGTIRNLIENHLSDESGFNDGPEAFAPSGRQSFNGGRPAGLSEAQWAFLTNAKVDEPASILDFVKSHVDPRAAERERLREEARLRDPEGWRLMQEETEARMRESEDNDR